MKCESCNECEATIAFTRIAGDDKQVLHLCANCAESLARQEKGTGEELGGAAPKKTPPKAPGKAAAGSSTTGGHAAPAMKVNVVVGNLARSDSAAACPRCGMTYEEFRKVGRFGCAQCYAAFAQHLQRLLKRVHGATRHAGKSPAGRGASPVSASGTAARPAAASEELGRLRQELEKAVAAEAYERAAELRDRITQLQAEAGAAGEAGAASETGRP